jgi:histidyl-tRNA synthetase
VEKLEVKSQKLEELDVKKLTILISEKALKYDLTVPFARYVVQHQHEITFPFKRYQIQPVWRADRPQKGRYREFYQCDADVIGSNSLINEVELVQMIDDVFTTLDVPVLIKINNRKILSGIAEVIGEKEKIITITVAIDKLDKIGTDGVNKELRENGVSDESIEKLKPLIEFKGSTLEKLHFLKGLLAASEIGLKGIEEVEYIFKTVEGCQLSTASCELDITLARGLNYYTGAIFEVKANVGTLSSSICGGGRYDDLTGIFGLPNMSGVGISFGADRIYDVLNEMNLYPESVAASTKLLFVTFGEAEQNYCLPLLAQVRKAGINSEVYPDAGAKMKKQMGYADDKKIPFVVIVGGDEMLSGMLSLKNMNSGEQEKISIEEIIKKLK